MTNVEQVRAAFVEFMQQTDYTQKQIADECGLSAPLISQFINGIYTGDNQKAANTLKKYLTIAKDRLNCCNATVFYPELENTKRVTFAAHYAHTNCEMVLIRGDSGAGKTTALKLYVEQNAGVIFVTANASTKSAASILSKIAAAAGRHPNGNKKLLMETLVSYLKDTKRLIIIDEADHLTLNALQAVRNLNDEANVGIVLSGNNKLYNQMVSGVRGYEFDQIRTRILLKPKVLNDYTHDEIAHIFPECDEKVIAILRKEATAESLREAIKLYNFCLTFTNSHGMKLTESVMLKLMKTM